MSDITFNAEKESSPAQSILIALGLQTSAKIKNANLNEEQFHIFYTALVALDKILERFPEWNPNDLGPNGPAWLEVSNTWNTSFDILEKIKEKGFTESHPLFEFYKKWQERCRKAGVDCESARIEEWPWMAMIGEGLINPKMTWEYQDKQEKIENNCLLVIAREKDTRTDNAKVGIFRTLLNAPNGFSAQELNHQYLEDKNLLHIFINHEQIRPLLLEKGMDPNMENHKTDAPLFYALNIQALTDLKNKGANLWVRNKKHLLYDAHQSNRNKSTGFWTDYLQPLIEHWKKIRGPVPLGETQDSGEDLLMALSNGNLEIAKKLKFEEYLKKGIPIIHQGKNFGLLGAYIKGFGKSKKNWGSFLEFLHHSIPVSVLDQHSGNNSFSDILDLKFYALENKATTTTAFENKLNTALKRWEPSFEKRIELIYDGIEKYKAKGNSYFDDIEIKHRFTAYLDILPFYTKLPLEKRIEFWKKIRKTVDETWNSNLGDKKSYLFNLYDGIFKLNLDLFENEEKKELVYIFLTLLKLNLDLKLSEKISHWFSHENLEGLICPFSQLSSQEQNMVQQFPEILSIFERQQLLENCLKPKESSLLDTSQTLKSKIRL